MIGISYLISLFVLQKSEAYYVNISVKHNLSLWSDIILQKLINQDQNERSFECISHVLKFLKKAESKTFDLKKVH